MADCFQLLGQLSGLASREKNYYFFLFLQLYCIAADRVGPSLNHICETKTPTRLGEDCLAIP